jgi:diadenosine tetraphosphatase ApaH/serine/threonine PP2A family protein phosphatase
MIGCFPPILTKAAFFGGIYSNAPALLAAIADARGRGAEALFCLGDLGGFGPHPERIAPILRARGVVTIQGNYEDALGNGRADCGCGYTDPRDNHFAQLAYDYTRARIPEDQKAWFRALPRSLRLSLGGRHVLLCHGSPRRQNEFLWESTSSDPFLRRLLDASAAEVLVCTHTGLPWSRTLDDGRQVINAGVLGRPANDGRTAVSYALVGAGRVDQIPVAYDHRALAAEMRDERLPEEFVETILTGFWTTCLEILPAAERRRGRF